MHFTEHPIKSTLQAAAGTVACIIILFLWGDVPADLWTHTLKGSDAYHAAKFLSLWANGTLWTGLAALCLAAGCAGRALKPSHDLPGKLLLVGISVAAAMVMGGYLKYFFGRFRPMEFIEHGLYGFTFFSTKYLQNSFPSGHTYRIFSAVTALSIAFPRGRILFFMPAVLIGISRVIVCRHYPSDVVFGAFIGVMCALWAGYVMKFTRIEK